MSPRTTRRLLAVHRWAGLILSLNVLVFAVTGLLLIFHEELDAALSPAAAAPEPASRIGLVRAIEIARASRPRSNAVYVSRDPEHPDAVYVGLAESSRNLEDAQALRVNLASGKLEVENFDDTFLGIVFRLHAQLLAGPTGALVVGAIGLALLLALVTGAAVYGPLMKRFFYGLLRRDAQRRNWLADLHKLLGASIFGWLAVVVITGIFLSLGSLLLQYYASNELRALSAAHQKAPLVESLHALDRAVAVAESGAPNLRWTIALMPGSDLASPRQYSVLLAGKHGIEQRMLTISLVDALEPRAVAYHELPLYLKALLVSEPLHFGDYGGLPLKLLWAIFTLALIVLAFTGIFTFFSTRAGRARVAERALARVAPAVQEAE